MIINNDLKPKIIRLSAGEVYVTPMPLRRDVSSSPWCYAANLTPPMVVVDHDENDSNASTPSHKPLLPPGTNFLATQVWPSSRIASKVIEKQMDLSWTVCELGCGPGLPSLTAARFGAMKVIATDVDPFALELVHAAAMEQGLISITSGNPEGDDVATEFSRWDEEHLDQTRFTTRIFDLTSKDNPLPKADLYVLSDVFESSAVAEGAAWHVQTVLSKNRSRIGTTILGDLVPQEGKEPPMSRVWVFAQSDRAQRELFLLKMREWYKENNNKQLRHLDWTLDHAPDLNDELVLFDLDETSVEYN